MKPGGKWGWWNGFDGAMATGVEDTEQVAKAAAQQDYENRILSALEPIHE